MTKYTRQLQNAVIKRKHQNMLDSEFKRYIKKNAPYIYNKAIAETNRIAERRRIIQIINRKINEYRKASKKTPVKLKYAYKILALHELLYSLDNYG
jgi:hypothetical protein